MQACRGVHPRMNSRQEEGERSRDNPVFRSMSRGPLHVCGPIAIKHFCDKPITDTMTDDEKAAVYEHNHGRVPYDPTYSPWSLGTEKNSGLSRKAKRIRIPATTATDQPSSSSGLSFGSLVETPYLEVMTDEGSVGAIESWDKIKVRLVNSPIDPHSN